VKTHYCLSLGLSLALMLAILGFEPAAAQRQQPQRRNRPQQQQQPQTTQDRKKTDDNRRGASLTHRRSDSRPPDGSRSEKEYGRDSRRENRYEKEHERYSRGDNRHERGPESPSHQNETYQHPENKRNHDRHDRSQKHYQERLKSMKRDYDGPWVRHDHYVMARPVYRYFRHNRYYRVNEYVAGVLREAIDYGYEEGYLAGRSDREGDWEYNYRDCYAYRDASLGYPGWYVDRDEYRYFFREGFRRGYEDGYYRVYHHGHYTDGRHRILATVLASIFFLLPLD